jgi:hypothetical protein
LHDKTINTFIEGCWNFVGIAFVDDWGFVGVAFVTPGRSTEDAMMILSESIYKAWKEKKVYTG